jgi:tetratricopeptide (TPR) repeat protein
MTDAAPREEVATGHAVTLDVAPILTRAVTLHQSGRLDEADRLYRQILAALPGHFDSMHLSGVIAFQRGHHVEALEQIDAAIRINPTAAAAYNNRGTVLTGLGRSSEALASHDRAIELDPRFVDAHYNRGNLLRELGRLDDAVRSYDQALAANPRHPVALNNRGNALKRLDRYEEALASYASALAIKPDYVEALNNRGNALKELGRHAEALASYDLALSLKPDQLDALTNRGACLLELHEFADASHSFEKALAIDPDHAGALWNRSLCRLLQGHLAEGWIDYEARWRVEHSQPYRRQFAQPQWTGDTDLAGKTLLVHAEQGLGDTLMMARYIGRLAALGAAVVFEVQAALRPLIDQMEGVTQTVSRGERLPEFDLHCPLLSLPLAFKTTLATIPASGAYLHAPARDVARWRHRLPASRARRVGLVWAGSPQHQNDRRRSMGLAGLLPLLAATEATFFSLQKELRPADADTLGSNPAIIHLGGELTSFNDTAAAIAHLDLVISVDTSVAHLAGAMGKPAWILLPFVPDWRWLLDREDSPWYPTARLFRQTERDDWSGVVARVAAEMGRLAKEGDRPLPGP